MKPIRGPKRINAVECIAELISNYLFYLDKKIFVAPLYFLAFTSKINIFALQWPGNKNGINPDYQCAGPG